MVSSLLIHLLSFSHSAPPRLTQWERKQPVQGSKEFWMISLRFFMMLTHRYHGPKPPVMPSSHAMKTVPKLKSLAHTAIAERRASELNHSFLQDIVTKDNCPEFHHESIRSDCHREQDSETVGWNLGQACIANDDIYQAEREDDWLLHLATFRKMLPYYFAAGHVNYARYGLYYVRSMEKLPPHVERLFLKDSTLHATSWYLEWTVECNSLSPPLWGTDLVQEGSLASHLSRTHWKYGHLVATSAAGWNPKC